MKILVFLLFCVFGFSRAELIRVFAAADLQYALKEIVELYEKKYPEDKIELIFGSSGKGFAQIRAGAPFHIYFSANMKYVEELYREGYITTEPKLYAVGRIVVWTRKDSPLDPSKFPEVLLDPRVKRIAIANWEHAPYGRASKEALQAYGVFEKIKDKLVLGDNISQTASFVYSGAAEVGIIALSLALAPQMQAKGKYWLIPEEKHERLAQGYGITKEGEKFKSVKRFYHFVGSPEARKILVKYGFLLPGEVGR